MEIRLEKIKKDGLTEKKASRVLEPKAFTMESAMSTIIAAAAKSTTREPAPSSSLVGQRPTFGLWRGGVLELSQK